MIISNMHLSCLNTSSCLVQKCNPSPMKENYMFESKYEQNNNILT